MNSIYQITTTHLNTHFGGVYYTLLNIHTCKEIASKPHMDDASATTAMPPSSKSYLFVYPG